MSKYDSGVTWCGVGVFRRRVASGGLLGVCVLDGEF